MKKMTASSVLFLVTAAIGCANRAEEAPVTTYAPPSVTEPAPPPQPVPPPPPEPEAPDTPHGHQLEGVASWYGPGFQGRPAANGEPFDQNKLTAAHRTLPFGTMVRVTRVDTGQTVDVEITDRGPVPKSRMIDLSKAAAEHLGITDEEGVCDVKVEVTKAAPESSE